MLLSHMMVLFLKAVKKISSGEGKKGEKRKPRQPNATYDTKLDPFVFKGTIGIIGKLK